MSPPPLDTPLSDDPGAIVELSAREAALRQQRRGDAFTGAAFEPWAFEPIGAHVAYLLSTSAPHGQDVNNASIAWPERGYASGGSAGLFGLLDGLGDWTNLQSYAGQEVWRVTAVDARECVPCDDGGGVLAPRGWVIYSGSALGALRLIQPRMLRAMREAPIHPLTDSSLLGHAIGFTEGATIEARDRHGNAVAFDGSARAWGPCAIAAAFGKGKAEARGYRGAAVTARRGSWAWAFGNYGRAVALESNSVACAVGKSALSVAAACYVQSAAITRQGVAAALSRDCSAMAMQEGAAIFLVEYEESAGLRPPRIASVFASRVGENGIKPRRYYKLRNGVPVEVESVIG